MRRHIRIEDALLFLWLVIRPVVLPDGGRAVDNSEIDPIGGLIDLVALCGAAACVGSRSKPGVQSGLFGEQSVAYAVGPLFAAVAFAIEDCAARLGLTGPWTLLPIVLPVIVAVVARLRLPPLSAEGRRALVGPFIFATAGFFGSFLSGITDIFDLRTLADAVTNPEQIGAALLVLGFAIAGTLIFYLMLVFAPRQIAEKEGTTATWAIRFVVFLVGLSLGTTLSGIVAGNYGTRRRSRPSGTASGVRGARLQRPARRGPRSGRPSRRPGRSPAPR